MAPIRNAMAMDTAMDTVTAMAMDTAMAIRKRKVQFLNQYGKGEEKNRE